MSRKNEENFSRNVKKTEKNFKLNFKINLEDQKWLNYSVIGSFVLLVILNTIISSKPIHRTAFEINSGLLGLTFVFFGSMFLLSILLTGREVLTCLVGAVLCIILFYFGLPLFLGFYW
jgi:hypothetical protein